MSRLLVKPAEARLVHEITPTSADWEHVGFALYDLKAGENLRLQQPVRELCLVVLTGTVSVRVGEQTWNGVGGRDSVFEDQAPGAIYVPAGERAEITIWLHQFDGGNVLYDLGTDSSDGFVDTAIELLQKRDIFTIEGKTFKVEKVDDYTVRFTLPVKFAPFLRGMGQAILPKHKLSSI